MGNENFINDYLQGNLSEEQNEDFKQRLKSDEDFNQEYLVQKGMHAYLLERNNRSEYTDKVEKLGVKYFSRRGGQSKPHFKRILILSVIVLATLLAAWYLLKPKEVNLYESNSEHFALHLVLKSDNSTTALNAENAFNRGDFDVATVAIQKYLESNAIDTKAKLALGICFLETGYDTEAIRIFDEITGGESTLRDYGTWYMALYYVKKLDFTEAKELLKTVPKTDVQLHSKTQQLLKELERLETK